MCSVKASDGQSIVTLESTALTVISQACVTITGTLLAINERSLATTLMADNGFQLEKQGYFGVL